MVLKIFEFKEHKLKVKLDDDSITFNRSNNNFKIHKSMRGETKVFFKNITDIKYQEPSTFKKGFIQFSTPRSNLAGAIRTIDQGSNAIIFTKKEQTMVDEIKAYVESKI